MILGVESSCDESSLAIFDPSIGLCGEWVHSQINIHKSYGGVVPDLASREHLINFPFMLQQISQQLSDNKISKVAVTCGPGLSGCLAMGVALAKSLSLYWDIPLAGVNHLRAHSFSPFINLHKENPDKFSENLDQLLPHLGLIVSGGNTILFEIRNDLAIHVVAQTVDDAAGEAFDKGSKLLGLEYPGGPMIEKLATSGDNKKFKFPRAFSGSNEIKFSFSGLKTSLRYALEKMDDKELAKSLSDICASYQEAIVDALILKTKQALVKNQYKSIGLSGGVANNQKLRSEFENLAENYRLPFYLANPEHTGDNAAMIAFAAYVDRLGVKESQDFDLSFYPSLTLDDNM